MQKESEPEEEPKPRRQYTRRLSVNAELRSIEKGATPPQRKRGHKNKFLKDNYYAF